MLQSLKRPFFTDLVADRIPEADPVLFRSAEVKRAFHLTSVQLQLHLFPIQTGLHHSYRLSGLALRGRLILAPSMRLTILPNIFTLFQDWILQYSWFDYMPLHLSAYLSSTSELLGESLTPFSHFVYFSLHFSASIPFISVRVLQPSLFNKKLKKKNYKVRVSG